MPTRSISPIRRIARAARLAMAGLGAASILAGCSAWFVAKPVAIVPLKSNAAEQYKFAIDYQAQANLPLITDVKRYENEREVVRQTYGKVVDYFPSDRVVTPLAKLDVIEIGLGLDEGKNRPAPTKAQIHEAIRQVEAVAKAYPEYEYVQAKALYLEGNYHKSLSEYSEAQKCFKQVMDNFKTNTDKQIKYLVDMSTYFYGKVYVNAP